MATQMYKQVTKRSLLAKAMTAGALAGAGALVGAGAGHLLWTAKEKLVDMLVERDESRGEVVTPEALLARCNDEQKKALWEALKAKQDD